MTSMQPFADQESQIADTHSATSSKETERACLNGNRFPAIVTEVSQLDSNCRGVSSNSGVFSWKALDEKLGDPFVLPSEVEIHLIRHAESQINAQKLITGAKDAELSQKGVVQAYDLGRRLDHSYDVAFASSLKRSQTTLSYAMESGHVSARQIVYDWRLSERSLGVLEGQRQQNIAAFAVGDLDYAPEGGESYREVAQRTLSFLYDLAISVRNHDVRKILICGHMGPMRILVGIIEECSDPATVLRFSFSNAEVNKLRWNRLLIPGFLKSSQISSCFHE